MKPTKDKLTDLIPLNGRERLFSQKISNTVLHISQEKVLTMIKEELSQEKFHQEQAGVRALRAGALFHILRLQMGEGYSGFWKLCEDTFKVSKMTVSRKMRLVAVWAKECGAGEKDVLELAQASDLTDKNNAALQLAFGFVGEDSPSDLYRKYKIVKPELGGKTSPRKKNNLTSGEALKEAMENANENWGNAKDFLEASNRDFFLCCINPQETNEVPDNDLLINAMISALERAKAMRVKWVNTPREKRDPKMLEEFLK